MGVVDQDRERLSLVDRLKPPGHLTRIVDRRDGGRRRNAESARGGERAEDVEDVEAARQRRAHVLLSPVRAGDRERRAMQAGPKAAGPVAGGTSV